MKQKINAFDYVADICKALPKGILLTTKAKDQINSMTIAWGSIGIEWDKQIFTAYVRESRYTKQMLDENGEFTINVPVGEYDKKIIRYCGTKSGRDTDKINDLGLTLVDSDVVSVPGIKELPLTLECKVIYKQIQDINAIPEAVQKRYYPQDVDSSHLGSNRDIHVVYFGEIVNAYLIEE